MPTMPTHRRPTTVGDMLREEFLKPLGLTQQAFADALGVDRPAVNAILNNRRSVTPEMALRLGHVLGTSAGLWLNLQTMSDSYDAERSQVAKEVRKLRRLVAG